MKRTILPILLSTIWISISEFVRNEFLFKDKWIIHYRNMDLEFPSEPVNGAVWGIWALVFSILIFLIAKKYSFWNTVLIMWIAGFILMWLVICNLGVLPFDLLYYAVPLSILEVIVSVVIIKKFQ